MGEEGMGEEGIGEDGMQERLGEDKNAASDREEEEKESKAV